MAGPLAGEPRAETRQYATGNPELERPRDWLREEGGTHVVMESTGSYWKPIFHVSEDSVRVYLANPREVKNRKGHKTGKKDRWWLAHLLRHAMLRPGFIPPRAIRELRDFRAQPHREDLAGRQSETRERPTGHFRLLRAVQVAELDDEIATEIREAGYLPQWDLLQTIPVLKETSAADVLAEVGSDTQPFASQRHLSSWAGVCPGSNRSAGKSKGSRTTRGNRWLRGTLTECAWAAAATKDCCLKEKFWRLATKTQRKGPALIALSHTLLQLVCQALSTGQPYQERGSIILNDQQVQRIIRRHIRRLGKLGVAVRTPASSQPKHDRRDPVSPRKLKRCKVKPASAPSSIPSPGRHLTPHPLTGLTFNWVKQRNPPPFRPLPGPSHPSPYPVINYLHPFPPWQPKCSIESSAWSCAPNDNHRERRRPDRGLPR